jgi:hypothetical protein
VEVGGGKVGVVVVRGPRDSTVPDETGRNVLVVPRDKLVELSRVLSWLKEALEGVVRDFEAGVEFRRQRHREHQVNASQSPTRKEGRRRDVRAEPSSDHREKTKRKIERKQNHFFPSIHSNAKEGKEKEQSPITKPSPIKAQ